MNLEMTLRMERAMGERDRRLPIPADVAALWRRARDDGVALGALHVLDTPMHPGIAGQHNRESGDIWVLHDPDDPDRTGARLIHELAHAAHPLEQLREPRPGGRRPDTARSSARPHLSYTGIMVAGGAPGGPGGSDRTTLSVVRDTLGRS